jgi:Kef-type K+ transport system membrane component KefB
VISDRAELVLLTFGVLLCIVGFAPEVGLSTMLASIVSGAVVANKHSVRGRLFEVLKPLTGILYTLFFVLAGASLHLELVQNMGALGVGYLVTRSICKLAGGAAGVRLANLHRTGARWIPLALVPHAGVAIGLTLTLDRIHPEFSALVKVVILSAIFFFEIVGPFSTKMSLRLSGEELEAVDTYDLDVLASGQDVDKPEGDAR